MALGDLTGDSNDLPISAKSQAFERRHPGSS
jgi:hypothetical protein